MGHFDPSAHPDFVLIDSIYADRPGLYLHRETYAAFLKMHAHAQRDGITLQIRSATRNFEAQKNIWERKWTGATLIENGKDASATYPEHATRAQMILKFSSMPGTSRHHWGTDMDLNAFDNAWFESGIGLRTYQWLRTHAHSYDFCQPYSAKGDERPHGYEEEKWHWSYLPLSKTLLNIAKDSLNDGLISGFHGAAVAKELKVVERYILGVHHECQ
jgi:LAS superfamily LD-carboxypeptidase LdcB